MKKIKVRFNLENKKERIIELSHQLSFDQSINCYDLMMKDPNGWLIDKKHPFQQTDFLLTQTSPFALIGFSVEGYYEGLTFSLNEGKAPFQSKQPNALFVLIPIKLFIEMYPIRSINIVAENWLNEKF